MTTETRDVVVVGGDPVERCAAVTARSEGVDVVREGGRVTDAARAPATGPRPRADDADDDCTRGTAGGEAAVDDRPIRGARRAGASLSREPGDDPAGCDDV